MPLPLVVIPATEASVLTDATPSPLDRVQKRAANAHLGRGITRPFRRGAASDFATAEAADLVRACVGQILGMRGSSETDEGELPWDPQRGSLLWRLRHQNNDLVLRELGRAYVVSALQRWEPRIRVRAVSVLRQQSGDQGANTLVILLVYDLIRVNVAGNQVLLSGIEQTVELRS